MKTLISLFFAVLMLLVSGCDRDIAKRLAYGAVQGVGQQRCMDANVGNQWGNCMKNDSYDEYQRKRREAGAVDNKPTFELQPIKPAETRLQPKGQDLKTE